MGSDLRLTASDLCRSIRSEHRRDVVDVSAVVNLGSSGPVGGLTGHAHYLTVYDLVDRVPGTQARWVKDPITVIGGDQKPLLPLLK
jgi:hypothetical protein